MVSALANLIGIEEMKRYLKSVLESILKSAEYHLDFVKKESNAISGYFMEFTIEKQKIEQHLTNIKVIQAQHENNTPLSFKEHHHHYRIIEMERDLDSALNCSKISTLGKKYAKLVFTKIIHAESSVHNVPVEEVHLHELGSIDTILDICGTVFGFEKLGLFDKHIDMKIFNSPISVGGGKIKTAHGLMQVPAPATSHILQMNHLKFSHGPFDKELATPTGVSILASLKELDLLVEEIPHFPYNIEKIGIGVGFIKLTDHANILRIFFGMISEESRLIQKHHIQNLPEINEKFLGKIHEVYIIKTNIDDIRGEIIGNLIQIVINSGALDISVINTITKKNRPGYLISIICSKEKLSQLSNILIKETGSLGVRISKSQRICLNREIITQKVKIENVEFEIHIKISKDINGNIIQKKLEYEDLLIISNQNKESIRKIEELIWSKIKLDV